jgi:hypothetical protein
MESWAENLEGQPKRPRVQIITLFHALYKEHDV